jgi:hypothetical protein
MESTNEANEFGNWILKELQEYDELHSEVWDFNGELITTLELYKRFIESEEKKDTTDVLSESRESLCFDKEANLLPEHKCIWCGSYTRQPDSECYANPANIKKSIYNKTTTL